MHAANAMSCLALDYIEPQTYYKRPYQNNFEHSGLEVRRYAPVWYTGASLVGLKSHRHLFLADWRTGMRLASWLSGKSSKFLRPDAFPRLKICQKNAFAALGRACVGSLQRSPDLLARYKGPTSKGRTGKERRGEEKKGGRKGKCGGEGKSGKGKEGKGSYWYFFFPTSRPAYVKPLSAVG